MQAVIEPQRERAKGAEETAAGREHPQIAYEKPHKRHEVGRGPVAIHVGFADADVATGNRATEKAFVLNDSHGAQGGRRVSENPGFFWTNHFQIATAQLLERGEEKFFGAAI